ncbi:hypothetical protein Fmac_001001 [Flemingia macrophylla]|uniref:F-box domain-containing protein n=1 Tax=Flemingia macrophylla TaxID=520843 RepID=A0ABD1NFZ5_9FABA
MDPSNLPKKKSKKARLPLPQTLRNELIEIILLSLAVRYLLRYKCVCKFWLSLISDSQFAKSHYLARAPTQRLLIKSPQDYKADSIDIEGDYAKLVFNVPNQSQHGHHCQLKLVDSCRGFLLLTIRPNKLTNHLTKNFYGPLGPALINEENRGHGFRYGSLLDGTLRRVKIRNFSYIVEKLNNRLADWKQNTLNRAGHVTLANSVSNSVPNYSMRTYGYLVECVIISIIACDVLLGETFMSLIG